MSERPILFSGPMVRAILSGAKTQTRRVVKPQPQPNSGGGLHPVAPYNCQNGCWTWVLAQTGHGLCDPFRCPYGKRGDRLWVRETWRAGQFLGSTCEVSYRADSAVRRLSIDSWSWMIEESRHRRSKCWRPSIHMPRWASRIDLLVKNVRVERLQDISEQDAIAEGVVPPIGSVNVQAWVLFKRLWDSINAAKHPWESNPWVWVVEFEREPKP